MMRSENAPRVAHDGRVTLLAGGAAIPARAVNLSKGGVFVEAEVPLPAGQAVHVHVDLLDGEDPVEAQGEVAWARGDGLAIRFLTVAEAAEARIQRRIQRAVDATRRLSRPVRVHLSSLPTPLRALARDATEESVTLEAELPWLKLGSEVVAELDEEQALEGVVRWVGLDVTRSGSARLRIHVITRERLEIDAGGVSGAEPARIVVPPPRPRRPWRWLAAGASLAAVPALVALLALVPRPSRLARVLAPMAEREAAPASSAPQLVSIPKAPAEAPPPEARHRHNRK